MEAGQPVKATAWRTVAAIAIGLAVAAWFGRRRIAAIVSRVRPYIRRRSGVGSPVLIINRWSGDGKAEAVGLRDHAEALGISTVMLERGDDLEQLAREAIDDGADAIGMAGGDGSLGLVAGIAAKRDVPFFCVPVGTRNHFALDLGLDRDDPLAALEALDGGDEIRIDHGVVGDRVFLNNVSFGVYASAVHRDGYRGEKVRTIAEVLIDAAADPTELENLQVTGPDGERFTRIPLLLISNGQYWSSGPPDFGRRMRMDEGQLGITAVTNLPDPDTVRSVTLNHLMGWHEWQREDVRVETLDGDVLAGVDGEAIAFSSPLDLAIRPKGLRVLVPAGVRPGYVPPIEEISSRLLDFMSLGWAAEDDGSEG